MCACVRVRVMHVYVCVARADPVIRKSVVCESNQRYATVCEALWGGRRGGHGSECRCVWPLILVHKAVNHHNHHHHHSPLPLPPPPHHHLPPSSPLPLDVVRAYKSLTKEKEALDACLKVLSKPTPPVPSSLPSDVAPVTPDKMVGITKNADESYSTVDGEQATPKKEVESEGETRDSDGVQSGGEGGGALAEGQDSAVVLMRQVETLTRTISTLSEERSKLEMNYQKDKKALLVHRG